MMSEKIELLGKDVYTDIPGELTLKAFPTVTELDYVGSEDFEKTMLDDIFPQCIEEKVDFHKLLEIDFQWVCRGLRFLNYGPLFTTNGLICSNCGQVRQEVRVDLRTVGCLPLPDGFKNDVVISKDDLIDYGKDIHIHLLTIQEALDFRKDKLFNKKDGTVNREYARICYTIHKMGNESVNSVTAKLEIEKKMSPADFKVLESEVQRLTDYGLRGGGYCQCPQCHGNTAAFMALADDRFFRPTVGDLREGRNDRAVGGLRVTPRSETEAV